jgi:hypothetical protein
MCARRKGACGSSSSSSSNTHHGCGQQIELTTTSALQDDACKAEGCLQASKVHTTDADGEGVREILVRTDLRQVTKQDPCVQGGRVPASR